MSQQIPSHTPTCWEEVFQWTWSTPSGVEFIPYEKDGYLWYYMPREGTTRHARWLALTSEDFYMFGVYKRVGLNPKYKGFMGPQQPPPSPVILKIRHMERRFNERVRHA